jgi:ssDNA-binding Zn-finger/Zn-ribbon topoisomerase 1
MGQLDQPAFDRLMTTGCTACGHATLAIKSYIDRTVVVMAADPNDAGRWAHDGEKFVDGTFHVECAKCAHVVFDDTDCPRCHAKAGLAKALSGTSTLVVPKRCPKCNELELMAIAFVPALARFGGGETPKPKPLVEFGEPGYHVVAYACDACDNAVVAEGCALCGAPGPLRPRP